MKRFGYLYEKIYSIDNLRLAHQNARRGKLHYSEVKIVDSNPDLYLTKIHNMLKEHTYRMSSYNVFDKNDHNKIRQIYVLPYYPDRIIQWAIIQVIGPIWDKTLIKTTYSSLKGRGIHKCVAQLKYDLYHNQADTKYCLKLDIKKFYPNINHNILKQIIRRKIKDCDVVSLIDQIIDSAPGVPIGNYLSQYLGNLYLSEFDHWIKETVGVKFYYRYCDDVVILASNKQSLHNIFNQIKMYLHDTLKLTIKQNYQIFPTHVRGIDFLGYRFFGNYTLLRKCIVKSMKFAFLNINWNSPTNREQSIIGSYAGWMLWCDSYRLYHKYIVR